MSLASLGIVDGSRLLVRLNLSTINQEIAEIAEISAKLARSKRVSSMRGEPQPEPEGKTFATSNFKKAYIQVEEVDMISTMDDFYDIVMWIIHAYCQKEGIPFDQSEGQPSINVVY